MFSVLIFPLLIISFTAAMSTKEYEIFDLQENTTDFLQEAAQWQLSNTLASTTTTTSICLGTYLVAGFQVLSQSGTIERTYTISKPHNSVFISFEAYMMGSWVPTDQATVQVKGGTTIFSSHPILTQAAGNGKVNFIFGGTCTQDPTSGFSRRQVFISSPHQGSALTLAIQSATTASTKTFGIRNVRILVSETVLTSSGQCIDITLTTVTNICGGCPAGKRKSGGTCVNCDLSCQSCFDASSDSCYACSSNYYYDGAKCQECFVGCATCSAGAETECLTCETDYFMYPNSSCKASCNPPYTSRTVAGIEHCYFPCNQTHDYYYSDGECRSTCEGPFTSRTDANGAKFCDYPCNSNEYLYPNGTGTTCQAIQCSGLFEIQNYYDSIEYKSCECVSPHILTVEGLCKEPIIIPPIPEKDNTIGTIGSVGNITGVINSVGLTIAAVALPGDPGGATTGALTKIIQYSKYLNISYPEKLMMMFRSYNPASGIVSFVPKMSDKQKSGFRYESIPYNFVAYGVHSCFVVNFWNSMLFLLVLLALCAGCMILEKLFKEAGIWVHKVRVILQNFWIVQLYNSSGDIMLFSVIQFKHNHWNSSESTLNFLMAMGFLFMVAVVLILHLRTLMKYQKIKTEGISLKKFEKSYECQQIFFGFLIDATMNHQLYLFYFVLRVMLVNLIIAAGFGYPMVQTIMMVAISLLLLIFIVFKRPFRSKIDLAQNLSYEAIMLAVNAALLSFASLDVGDEAGIETRRNLAEVIIVCSVIFTFLPFFFLVLKAIVLGIEFYKAYKKRRGENGSLASAKGTDKLDFIQRVEELRMARRATERGLNIGQGMNIRNNVRDDQLRRMDYEVQVEMNNSRTAMMVSNYQDQSSKGMRNNHQFSDALSTLYPLNNSTMNENDTSSDMNTTLDLNNSNLMVENRRSNFHQKRNRSRSIKNQVTRNNNHELLSDLSMNIDPSKNPHHHQGGHYNSSFRNQPERSRSRKNQR